MPFWASTVDLDYTFGQVEVAEETAKQCVITIVGGDCTGHYRFNRGFYGLADMPVVFQDKLDRVLEGKAPAWQDDMLVITKGTMLEHYERVADVLQKLDDNGYKASLSFSRKMWSGADSASQMKGSNRKIREWRRSKQSNHRKH